MLRVITQMQFALDSLAVNRAGGEPKVIFYKGAERNREMLSGAYADEPTDLWEGVLGPLTLSPPPWQWNFLFISQLNLKMTFECYTPREKQKAENVLVINNYGVINKRVLKLCYSSHFSWHTRKFL